MVAWKCYMLNAVLFFISMSHLKYLNWEKHRNLKLVYFYSPQMCTNVDIKVLFSAVCDKM